MHNTEAVPYMSDDPLLPLSYTPIDHYLLAATKRSVYIISSFNLLIQSSINEALTCLITIR